MCGTEKAKTTDDAGLSTSTATGRHTLIDHRGRDANIMEAISKRIMVVVLPFLLGLVFISSAVKGQTDVEPLYQIAFANFGPQNTDIFIADADGSNARPFLSNPVWESMTFLTRTHKWASARALGKKKLPGILFYCFDIIYRKII